MEPANITIVQPSPREEKSISEGLLWGFSGAGHLTSFATIATMIVILDASALMAAAAVPITIAETKEPLNALGVMFEEDTLIFGSVALIGLTAINLVGRSIAKAHLSIASKSFEHMKAVMP